MLESVAPSVAGRWGVQLFVKPFRFAYPPAEQAWLEKANQQELQVVGQPVKVYRWGKGKPAILMHGWSGRGTQLHRFIQPLINKGFEVIAMDATGHGKSGGKTSNLIEFAAGLEQLITSLDETPVYIGHSLGGAAGYLGMSQNQFQLKRMVSIGTPTIGADIISEFLQRINGRPASGQYLDQYVQKRFGNTFAYYSAIESAKRLQPHYQVPTLVVHGERDREAPVAHSEALHQLLKSAQLLVVPDVGHTSILKNEDVVQRIVEFVAGEEDTDEPEALFTAGTSA
ncbi:MAG: alpha/beta fold hydrolase [Salibacteraceae bacterium]